MIEKTTDQKTARMIKEAAIRVAAQASAIPVGDQTAASRAEAQRACEYQRAEAAEKALGECRARVAALEELVGRKSRPIDHD